MDIKIENIKSKFMDYLPKIIVTIIIIIVTFIIALYYKSTFYDYDKDKDKTQQKSLIYEQLSYIVYYVIIFIGFIIALCNLGFQVASILTLLATFGFAMGLAIQGTLTNISAGIYIGFNELFSMNDIIKINDNMGIVTNFNLFNTTITDVNKQTVIIIPNTTIQSGILTNITKNKEIVAFIKFSISNNNKNINIKDLINNIHDTLLKSPFITNKNNISINVSNMEDSGTLIGIKAPVLSAKLVTAEGNIRTLLTEALFKNNILLKDNGYMVNTP